MHKGSKVIIVVVQVGAVKIYVKQHWRCSGKKTKEGVKKTGWNFVSHKNFGAFLSEFHTPLNLRHHPFFAFSALKARQDKRSIFLPPPHHKVKRRNMFLLLHFYSLLTEMMFSSLFQHFGKGEREREACAFSNDYLTTIHVKQEKEYLQQSKKSTMSIIG